MLGTYWLLFEYLLAIIPDIYGDLTIRIKGLKNTYTIWERLSKIEMCITPAILLLGTYVKEIRISAPNCKEWDVANNIVCISRLQVICFFSTFSLSLLFFLSHFSLSFSLACSWTEIRNKLE